MALHLRMFAIPALVLLAACGGVRNEKSHGPIVLGDSSTIVTETNPDLLVDQVQDLKPVLTDTTGLSSPPDTASKPQQAPAEPAPAAATAPMSGLVAAFKEITVNILGITTRMYHKQDLQHARAATYELSSGSLDGAQLRCSGGTVTSVKQRVQTMLMLKDGNDRLILESLPKQTSAWEEVKGSGGVYAIEGLGKNDLSYKLPSANALRRAVQTAARRAHLNRRDAREWEQAVRELRSANQDPAVVVLRAVMWRISGNGFSKELRIDVPVQ